ncbi:MAG: hypothetical protein FWF12_03795 [Betaproteobacteria bacterium]|nr:hypothetical protein [Betaproteobacteria bacterium]
MNAIAWMFLLLLIAGLAYVAAFHMRARVEKRNYRSHHGSTSTSGMNKSPLRAYKFNAVELRICENPCESALAIAGKRLLKSEAPALPLGGCPHIKHMCTYIQYNDRRLTQRRSESYPYGMPMCSPGRIREERRMTSYDRRVGSSGRTVY